MSIRTDIALTELAKRASALEEQVAKINPAVLVEMNRLLAEEIKKCVQRIDRLEKKRG